MIGGRVREKMQPDVEMSTHANNLQILDLQRFLKGRNPTIPT